MKVNALNSSGYAPSLCLLHSKTEQMVFGDLLVPYAETGRFGKVIMTS
jgi:hypothetical protein